MILTGRWLGIALAVLLLWLAFLGWNWRQIVRQPRQNPHIGIREFLTRAGMGFAIAAVCSLLLLHLSWISVSLSQKLGVPTLKILSMFLFWLTLAGLFFSAAGSGRKRFWGLGSCLITGLYWFSLAVTSAISMAAPIARHSVRFLIPANYVGWVEIKYGVSGAPALRMKDGTVICQIPFDGLLATSSLLEQGWAKDEYFYYSQDGSIQELNETGWEQGGMVWGGSDEWEQTPSEFKPVQVSAYFYVGPEKSYQRAVSNNERRPFNESAITGVPDSR